MTGLTLTAALDLHAAGCPVRASIDGTKTPLGAWKAYQDPAHRPTVDQLNGWFGNGHAGIGIITGAASGNVEMLEFEGCAVAEGVLTSWGELMDAPGLCDIKPRLMTGYLDATPTGVLHLHYRIDGKPVPGNTKLARRPPTADELARERLRRGRGAPALPRVPMRSRRRGSRALIMTSALTIPSLRRRARGRGTRKARPVRKQATSSRFSAPRLWT
jgi:hypothetical protein